MTNILAQLGVGEMWGVICHGFLLLTAYQLYLWFGMIIGLVATGAVGFLLYCDYKKTKNAKDVFGVKLPEKSVTTQEFLEKMYKNQQLSSAKNQKVLLVIALILLLMSVVMKAFIFFIISGSLVGIVMWAKQEVKKEAVVKPDEEPETQSVKQETNEKQKPDEKNISDNGFHE